MYQADTGRGAAAACADAKPARAIAQSRTRILTTRSSAPRRAPRQPLLRAGRAHALPTPSPRERAPAAQAAVGGRLRPHARGLRSAPAASGQRVLRTCLDGTRQLVTCLCRLGT